MSTQRASTRTRSQPQTASSIPAARVTRLRSGAQAGAASPAAALGVRPPVHGIIAKSKEGLRKVSDKLKEKEKEAAAAKAKPAPDTYTEQLQSYLRIRPQLESDGGAPYLEVQDQKSVLMRPPVESRLHMPKPAHSYSFDKVFGPDTAQDNFFENTTRPLVQKLLHGENGLLFAYGVSNSGKTYTIQGGDSTKIEERGVLPRSIDVVFNSIKGHETKVNLKCQGLADVVLTDDDEGIDLQGLPYELEARLEDSVKVDRNFSYAVFVSYVEVYNDKIFDLLDSVLPSTRPKVAGSATPRGSAMPRSSAMPRTMSTIGLSGHIGSSMSLAAMANGGGGVLKRRALVLKNDPEGNGKYICGAHDIRVRTREEALAVFRCGQRARQVFGTMANRESSRSHGIFTIKVVRVHNGAPEDPDSAQVSRLAIVDLAGSERTRNTHNTGDRLKEAGNINKSLMVLGQCLEVLRSNQQRMAAPGAPGARKKLAMVPFRHSKLTEIFQNFFVGDGRAVMMIHVNPYDTGFDENSHVMRFSAIAREIQTTATHKTTIPTLRRQISSHLSAFRTAIGGGQKIKVTVPVVKPPEPAATTPPTPTIPVRSSSTRANATRPSRATAPPAATTSTTTTSRATRSRGPTPPKEVKEVKEPEPEPEPQVISIVEEELEVVEEDAEDESDDEEHDMLVDYLFDQLRELKTQLFESEMRNSQLEVEIREEVSKDLQDTIKRIHADYEKRIKTAAEAAEAKADMKLDIVQRTMADVDSSFDESFDSADETMDSTLSDPFLGAPIRPANASATLSEREVEEEISLIFQSSDVSGSREGNTTFESESDSDEEMFEDQRQEMPPAELKAQAQADISMYSSSDEEEEPVELRPITPRASGANRTPTSSTPTGASAPPTTETMVIDRSGEVDSDGNISDEEGTVEGGDQSVMSVGSDGDDESDTTEIEGDAASAASDEDSADDDSADEDDSGDDEDDEDDESDGDFDSSFASSAGSESTDSINSEPSPARRLKVTPRKSPKKPKIAPLRESKRQVKAPMPYNEDEELVKDPTTPAKSKKKRTLGKRIVTADEMERESETPVAGAEVRRMVRGL